MAPFKSLALLALFSASQVLAATFMSMDVGPVLISTSVAVINSPIDVPASTSFAVPSTTESASLSRFISDIVPTSSNGVTIQTSALTNGTVASTTLLVSGTGNATMTTESGSELPTTVVTTTIGGGHTSGHVSGTKTGSASASATTGAAGKVGVGAAVGFGALVVGLVGA